MLHKIKTIIVGIEPFSEQQSSIDLSIAALRWFAKDDVRVIVTAVLNPDDLGCPFEFNEGDWLTRVRLKTYEDIEAGFKQIAKQEKFSIEVLAQNEVSRSKTVECFLAFAKENNADLIVVHSHTKSSFLSGLGSFCDKLVRQSRIPVLVLPLSGEISPQLARVLFPTDFSGLSKMVFKAIALFCSHVGAKLTLYHRRPRPIDEIIQMAIHQVEGRSVMPSDLVTLDEEAKRIEGEEWKQWASSADCIVTVETDTAKITLPTAIVSHAKLSKADLIALPSHTAQVTVPTIGCTAMHVLRISPIPVIVVPVPYIPPGSFESKIKG